LQGGLLPGESASGRVESIRSRTAVGRGCVKRIAAIEFANLSGEDDRVKRFIEGGDRSQASLLPECPDDYVIEDNPVRVVDGFVEQLDLRELGFEGMDPLATGRPSFYRRSKCHLAGWKNNNLADGCLVGMQLMTWCPPRNGAYRT
jgi:hypothetical protein